MAEETIMVLKADLECSRCCKKVKKLLCRYSEIRDQVFYEKEDTVMIKVVCCSPERIRSKLIRKSDGVIKSIEIRKLEKPKPTPAPQEPKSPPQKKVTFQLPEKPKEVEKPKTSPEKPKDEKKGDEKAKAPPEKSKEAEKPPKQADPPKAEKTAVKPLAAASVMAPAPVPGYPQFVPVCCKPCYEMGHGGPCQHSYGVPYQPPPSSYDGYVRLLPSYGEPSYGDWSSRCRCNRSYGCRCHHECFTEENPSCTIM